MVGAQPTQALLALADQMMAGQARVVRAPDELRATVEDDGTGFELRRESTVPVSGGTGIRSMHERAAGLGDRLRIWSAPDNGTRLELVVALSTAGTGGGR